ncbi:hypothetical protein [Actinomycetospora lemnae]|uniref:Uncharacterized protein n=1 Tax=Actinomycetospora lemnae TaxID=3019891 RepID=A0ABT5SU78_9PSEU|nr:hypothetical protein [Actinomycetospora sp. DW7H6]MDD7966412.1 hypothetical protein [Actinomycetospora sp. DW7H6]
MNEALISQAVTAVGVFIAAVTLVSTVAMYFYRMQYDRALKMKSQLTVFENHIVRLAEMLDRDFADDIASTVVDESRFDEFFKSLYDALPDSDEFQKRADEFIDKVGIFPVIHTKGTKVYEDLLSRTADIASCYRQSYPALFRVMWTSHTLFSLALRNYRREARDEGNWQEILSGTYFAKGEFSSVRRLRIEFAAHLRRTYLRFPEGMLDALLHMNHLVMKAYLDLSPLRLTRQATREKRVDMQPMEATQEYAQDLVHARVGLETILSRDDQLTYEEIIERFERAVS